MTKTCFTAQELFSMAHVSKKQKMYGVPDAFAQRDATKRERAMRQVCDNLVNDSVMDVDFEGNYCLHPANADLVQFICEPDMCLSIELQRVHNPGTRYIFWRKRNQTLWAEVENNRFRFFRDNPEWVLESCRGVLQGTDIIEKTVIPRIALQKASRFCKANIPDDAIRILRQNSASEKLATVIVDYLCNEGAFIGATLLCLHDSQPQKRRIAFLSGRNIVLSIGETITNLRTCSVFTGVTTEHAEGALESMLLSFMNCE